LKHENVFDLVSEDAKAVNLFLTSSTRRSLVVREIISDALANASGSFVRVAIPYQDLADTAYIESNNLLKNPVSFLRSMREALIFFVSTNIAEFKYRQKIPTFIVGITGDLGHNNITPAEIRSSSLYTLFRLEGMISYLSEVHSKIISS